MKCFSQSSTKFIMFTSNFMNNWNEKTNSKIINFHLENNIAKFFYSNLEVFMTIANDTIAVAVSGNDCTFSRIWKEKGITQEEIRLEIDNFLKDCEKKLINRNIH